MALTRYFYEGEVMKKAVLFDFGGVLTLDETGSESICSYIAKVTEVNKELLKMEHRKFNPELLTGKLKHEDIWQALCDRIGERIDIEALYESFIHTLNYILEKIICFLNIYLII